MKFKATLKRVVLVEVEVEADSQRAARDFLLTDCNDLDYFHAGQIVSDILTVKSVERNEE